MTTLPLRGQGRRDDLQAALALSLHGCESQESSNACAAVVKMRSGNQYLWLMASIRHRSPLPCSAHEGGTLDMRANIQKEMVVIASSSIAIHLKS